MSKNNKRKLEEGDKSNHENSNHSDDSQNHDSKSTTKKRLSCQRCRSRKVKCDFETPCHNCVKAGVDCVQTTDDMRKKRPPATYVSKLEAKIESLTKFIQQFKQSDSIESKTDLVNHTDFEQLMNKELLENKVNSSGSSPSAVDAHHHDEDEDRAFYGPTSVYNDALTTGNSKLSKKDRDNSHTINKMNKDPDILNCVKLFFTWQYPDHNMFIFREAFLIDFFNPKPNNLYCSQKLILSICALGARMSDDDRIYNKSKQYYREAKSLLLNQLSQPSITSLQSFMLLAFYDICSGLNSSGWMLSGNAMRMGFDLGFQLNPQVWFVESSKKLSNLDVDIRSRIYWGCFMADHFISLLLGRPAVLKISDASISETNDLPDLEWIDDFTYEGYVKQQVKGFHSPSPQVKVSYISDPLRKIINLISISDNMLNDIFSKSEQDESNSEDLDLISRWQKLIEYNAQIMKWKMSLPDDLQWNREKLKATGENPTYSCIRYYYYILLLCLNRPFVGIETDKLPKDHYLSPLSICSNAIDDLYESIKKFQSVHGYRRVSIFIVYSSILSISIILLTNTSKQLVNEKKDRLQFFMGVLYGCSKTWKLAEKSYNLIKEKLRDRYETGELQDTEKQNAFTKKQPKAPKQTKLKPVNIGASIKSDLQASQTSPPSQSTKISTVRSTFTPPTANKQQPQPQRSQYPSQYLGTPPTGAPAASTGTSTSVSTAANTAQISPSPMSSTSSMNQSSIVESNTNVLFDKNLDFLGGPPVLMTSDLFNEDWEALFPDYIFNSKN